jgi:hypothetical protein
MLARVLSGAVVGVEAALIRVEVDVTSGLPVNFADGDCGGFKGRSG